MKLATKIAVGVVALLTSFQAHADIKVTDVEGRHVVLEKPAERVLLGFNFEDFIAIVGDHAMDRVVAISRPVWQGWRPAQYAEYVKTIPSIAKLTDVGDTEAGTFSIETAIAARPDLAILADWQYKSLGSNVKQLEQAGIPVVVIDYNAQTLEKHLLSTHLIGKVMGAEKRADELADLYESRFNDTLARVKNAKDPQKKVYVELAKQGPSDVGNSYANTMWGGLIDLLGGDNIANGQITNWGPLSPEYVLASQPDVIFLSGSEWLNAPAAIPVGFGADSKTINQRMKAYLSRPGWSDLPAIKTNNFYAIYHGGARTLSDFVYMRYIAKILNPDAFQDVDPKQELADFYHDWLPVSLNGIFFQQYQQDQK